MSYREQDGQVILTMSQEDYQMLLMLLGAGVASKNILSWKKGCEFLNRGGQKEVSTVIRVTLTGKIYAKAIWLAQSANQVVGEKSDYYITLAQLEDILQNVEAEKK